MTTPKPSHATLTIPLLTPVRSIHLISNLLTPLECNNLILIHSHLTPSNVTPATLRDREVFSDGTLASLLWERIAPFFENERVEDEEGERWSVSGLNEMFRLCRYVEGGKFSPHTDGRRLESLEEQSFMTINIYLNTVDAGSQGATRFLFPPPTPTHCSPTYPRQSEILTKVQPQLGRAIIFRDDVWHDGEEVVEGVKYLLRTDVMYKREKEFDFERLYGGLDEEGKGRKALGIAEGLEDAGKGGEAIRWYKKAFGLWPGLEK